MWSRCLQSVYLLDYPSHPTLQALVRAASGDYTGLETQLKPYGELMEVTHGPDRCKKGVTQQMETDEYPVTLLTTEICGPFKRQDVPTRYFVKRSTFDKIVGVSGQGERVIMRTVMDFKRKRRFAADISYGDEVGYNNSTIHRPKVDKYPPELISVCAAIMNSALLEYLFRAYSRDDQINTKNVKALPVPCVLNSKVMTELATAVRELQKAITWCEEEQERDLLERIEGGVFELYGINEEETRKEVLSDVGHGWC